MMRPYLMRRSMIAMRPFFVVVSEGLLVGDSANFAALE
jgi:hypothetical protein